MKCKISDTSYIINFMDTRGGSDEIIPFLESKFNKILDSKQSEVIEDWEVHYKIIYNNVGNILISKTAHHIQMKNIKKS